MIGNRSRHVARLALLALLALSTTPASGQAVQAPLRIDPHLLAVMSQSVAIRYWAAHPGQAPARLGAQLRALEDVAENPGSRSDIAAIGGRFNLDVTKGPVTLGYEARYLGKMVTSTYENFFPLDSACSAAVPPVCPPLNADAIEPRFYPTVVYHDLRLDIAVKKGSEGDRDLNFYVGVDNIFDKQPPLGTTATGAGSAIYNIRGRNYYAGFRARF